MSRRWFKIAVVVALIFVPFVITSVYEKSTALPKEIAIAAGPPGGRYLVLSGSLAREIEKKLKVKVHVVSTDGSLENLLLLQAGQAEFVLYQAGTLEIFSELEPDSLREAGLSHESVARTVAFIASLDSQPEHLIVRRGAGINTPADLRGKTVNLGLPLSGSHAMSLVLLQHFGLTKKSVNAKYIGFPEIKQQFLDATLDAAFINLGVQSPIFPELFATGKCSILSIPYAEAFTAKHVGMSQYKIPAGIYRYGSRGAPATDIQTVAARMQLLTRTDVPARLVEEVTQIVLSEQFMKKNALQELFVKGPHFAREVPDFSLHPGARRVYEPGPRPLLPPEFVVATEGARSFIFSLIIALFFGIQWLRNKRSRKQAHKLERYIRRLLATEQRQVSLGVQTDANDAEKLQELLDRVTQLKQEAFGSFSVHEVNEDRAVSFFLQMCDGLSDKINTKISRQRLHRRFDELSAAMNNKRENPKS